MDNAKQKFNEYVLKFDSSNIKVSLKHTHSFRVANYAKEIAKSLNLEEEDIYLAELIGLLHDIGRFDQATKFNTFDDSKSFDHGDFGAYLLFDEMMIKSFHSNEDDYPIIKAAIINHNKYKIKDGLNERELLMSKIIRDADKLDIFYVVLNEIMLIDLEDGDANISVLESFKNHQTVNNKFIKTKQDKIISILAFIFDLNYPHSLKVVEDKFLEPLLMKYEVDDEIIIIINKYIKESDLYVKQ